MVMVRTETSTKATGPPRVGLGTLVGTELTRVGRGFGRRYTILVSVALLLMIASVVLRPPGPLGHWVMTRDMTLQLWTNFAPLHCALLAGMAVRQDTASMRFLLSYPISRVSLFAAKFVALAVLTLVPQAVVFLGLSGVSFLYGGDPFSAVFGQVFIPWVAGLGVLALMLLVATAWGLVASIGIGVGGLVLVVVADMAAWMAVPFAWAYRSLIPLVGVHPSGIRVEPGHPALDPAAIPVAVGLSLVLTVLALFVGGLVMKRRQM